MKGHWIPQNKGSCRRLDRGKASHPCGHSRRQSKRLPQVGDRIPSRFFSAPLSTTKRQFLRAKRIELEFVLFCVLSGPKGCLRILARTVERNTKPERNCLADVRSKPVRCFLFASFCSLKKKRCRRQLVKRFEIYSANDGSFLKSRGFVVPGPKFDDPTKNLLK